jgi:hypothetical protein
MDIERLDNLLCVSGNAIPIGGYIRQGGLLISLDYVLFPVP